MLGKRKRDHAVVSRQSLHGIEFEEAPNTTKATDLFKQYFEAKFEPLPKVPSLLHSSSTEEDGFEVDSQSETSGWSGFTENQTSVDEVQVVEHKAISEETAESGALEGKHFMVRSDQMCWKPSD